MAAGKLQLRTAGRECTITAPPVIYRHHSIRVYMLHRHFPVPVVRIALVFHFQAVGVELVLTGVESGIHGV
jgi:hypothetical protein